MVMLLQQWFLQIDNVALENSVCFPPTAITANPVGTNTATLNWTAPVSNPTYEYYLSQVSTAPTPLTGATGTGAAGSGLTLIEADSVYLLCMGAFGLFYYRQKPMVCCYYIHYGCRAVYSSTI
jgi:hypothetical protein